MIVKDHYIEAAVEYLADPTAASAARFHLNMCQNKADEIWARLYKQAVGTIEEKKATATAASEYQIALANLARADADWEEHKLRGSGSRSIIEAWTTESNNIRAAERVR